MFGLERFSPTVLARPPLYAPENVSVPSVAVRSARLDPSAIPEIVEFCKDALGTLDTVSDPPTFDSPVPSRDVNVEPPTVKFVVEAVVNEPYVVDDRANLFSPEKKLVSERSVVEAVESVVVIVIGAEPSTVNDVHVDEPAHDTDVVATVLSNPFVPTNVSPCDSDERYTDDPNVDDAVENRPLANPIVVDVEL